MRLEHLFLEKFLIKNSIPQLILNNLSSVNHSPYLKKKKNKILTDEPQLIQIEQSIIKKYEWVAKSLLNLNILLAFSQ